MNKSLLVLASSLVALAAGAAALIFTILELQRVLG